MYTLYIIRLYDDVESFYKIGVTSRENPYERFSIYPYEKDIICLYQHPSSHLIMDLESKCISLETKYTPQKEFGGKSECVESNKQCFRVFRYLGLDKRFKGVYKT